jgi:pilus retraction protein PilT
MSSLRELLTRAVGLEASDIHITSGHSPVFRVHQQLVESGFGEVDADTVAALGREIMPGHLHDRFRTQHECDFSFMEEGVGRFRASAFQSIGCCTLALRHVRARIPSFEDLHLPPQIKALSMSPRGIILAAGTTGCGKSTTLAAILQNINATLKRRIITIEDPIEYVFENARSLISQREVALDTASFHAGLRHVLRQDPDVIMIGEMRDADSFMAALAAAETGHLVLSTLHTGTAAQAVPRILDLFPSSERDQLRMALAENLRAVFCQRLIPCVRGGVRPAVEILINSPTVRKLLERNLIEKLPAAIETGTEDGMQTFNQAVYALIKGGEITEEIGLRHSGNPEALRMNLKGIFLDEARRILTT